MGKICKDCNRQLPIICFRFSLNSDDQRFPLCISCTHRRHKNQIENYYRFFPSQLSKIVAICEMYDQACGVEDYRIIDNTAESRQAYENLMDENMQGFGVQISFYDAELPYGMTWDALLGTYQGTAEQKVYDWMRENAEKELEFD